MIALRKYIHQRLLIFCIFFLIFFFSPFILFADGIGWLEVSKTNNELLSIKPDSIKYNNKGFLSVLAKYSEIDLDDQTIINNDSFLMAIDCENRLFSKFPVNADLKQVKSWVNPINNKLIKKAIINSCSY
ncbi:hypothetical protein [Prochlorococcus marinus]|uniref:hypothetical protein n=1 Tax=Prochlorococcus marinus TaxID=1219 RepID=UPI0022B3E8F2|nr:hypothetical protein [Prochlorococcus marinus]